jgi:antitoxin ParD1/3/4
MSRASQPVTVTLGEMKARVDERVRTGRYASASEVLRAGLRALDREEAALDNWMRLKVQEAFEDPRPRLSLAEAFADVRAHAAKRTTDGR